MENQSLPPYLYKYKSVNTNEDLSHLLDIIENNKIYFPFYDILNDPLEGNIMEIHLGGYAGCGMSLSVDAEDVVVGGVKSHFQILSLSSRYNSPLMWAHYADTYEGVCLCYSTDRKFKQAKPVEYRKERVYIDHPEVAELNSLVESGFYLKQEEWSYESEWRIVKYRDESECEEPQSKFIEYEQKELKGIIIGHKAKPELIELIKEKLPEQVKLMKTHVGHRTFQIGILPIDYEIVPGGGELPYISDMESYLE